MVQRVMTRDEFIEKRSDLPDAGQWAELIRGVPVSLTPPDLEHGTIVLNLSKMLSEYVHRSLNGYACFDLGLQVEHRPDTIFFPAVSYFTKGERFAEADREVTDTVPDLVIELLTTNERRRSLNERIGAYLRHGVNSLWMIDPDQQVAHVVRSGGMATERVNTDEDIIGPSELPGLVIPVRQLFLPPAWA